MINDHFEITMAEGFRIGDGAHATGNEIILVLQTSMHGRGIVSTSGISRVRNGFGL